MDALQYEELRILIGIKFCDEVKRLADTDSIWQLKSKAEIFFWLEQPVFAHLF